MRLTQDDKMTVAAHRGDSYNYYENTMTAFRMALENGATMIETDVRLTKDLVPVLLHDGKVDRTTNGHGLLAEMTFEQVKKLNAADASAPEGIPTLTEFMEWAKEAGVTLNLEIKEYYVEGNEERCALCIEKVLAEVEKHGLTEKVVINSFDAWVLEYVYKKHGKKYPLHGFYPYTIMKNVTLDPAEYLDCACLFSDTDESFYTYLLERGIEPWIGAGVTQESHLALCKKYGARLITTNNPKDTIEKLNRIESK